MPKIPSLRKICNGFGITLSQFFSEGEGMVFLTQEQKEMLDHWSALNEQQRKIIIDLLKNM